MSRYYNRISTLSGLDISNLSDDDLKAMVRAIVKGKLHGVAYSPYMDGQSVGMPVGEAQIRERLEIIRHNTQWIRTFSCTVGNEATPAIASEFGLKSMVGAWIDDDRAANEAELANAIEIAKAGHASVLAIGNEVLLRGELSEDELISYIERAKAAVGDVPVGYVDAYFLFENHPRVAAACDVLLVNCYPFWEEYPAEHAFVYMKEMYHRAVAVANGKKVIIAETGWPDKGTPEGGAVPSLRNAMKYFIDACRWAAEEGVDLFYFAAFDEEWKIAKEGDVGAYWGIWDKNGVPKYF
ncbi:MAG: glycosyl hydrolase family 17 protein [Pseudomonadota bacterium]